MADNLERCFICDEPTGRAGRGDDSIYREDGTGPYCEECSVVRDTRVDTLERELAEALAKNYRLAEGHALLEQQRDRLREDYKRLLDICPTFKQFNGMADFILRRGDLDNNAQCLTQMILRQKADELKALAGGEGE